MKFMAATYGSKIFLLIHKNLGRFVRQFINKILTHRRPVLKIWKKHGFFIFNKLSFIHDNFP